MAKKKKPNQGGTSGKKPEPSSATSQPGPSQPEPQTETSALSPPPLSSLPPLNGTERDNNGLLWIDVPQVTEALKCGKADGEVLSVRGCNLDSSLDQKTKGPALGGPTEKEVTVVTNYVAVKKTPPKVYVYSIEFGECYSVKQAEKQLEEKARKLSLEDSNEQDTEDAPALRMTKPSQRSERARIFEALENCKELEGIQWATDHLQLWTLQKLPESAQTIRNVKYQKQSGKEYILKSIAFTSPRELDLGTGGQASLALVNHEKDDPVAGTKTQKGASMRLTALNALISKHVRLNNKGIFPAGPNKFFLTHGRYELDETFDIHRGYFTSVRPGNQGVLLNINLATSAFFRPISVAEFMKAASRLPGEPTDLLKGLLVRIAHQREQFDQDYDPNLEENRKRVIAGFGLPPEKQDFKRNGTKTTVAAYFTEELGMENIVHPDLPCVSVNINPHKANGQQRSPGKQQDPSEQPPVTPQWILPELLHIEPYQAFNRLLAQQQSEKMIEVAVRHPHKTLDMILTEGFQQLGIGAKADPFKDLQLTVGDKLLQIRARQMQVPGIHCARSPQSLDYRDKGASVDVTHGSWGLKGVLFNILPPAKQDHRYPLPRNICTVDLRRYKGDLDFQAVGQDVSKRMTEHGIQFSTDVPPGDVIDLANPLAEAEAKYLDEHPDHPREEKILYKVLEAVLKEKLGHLPARESLILFLLPSKDAQTYGQIKRVCDQYMGLHSVCVVTEKRKALPGLQFQSNLAMKYNLKLRGQNHQVMLTGTTSSFKDIANDTVVFGADVSHAGSSMPFTPSVATVVASEDKTFGQFPGSMRLQASTQEFIAELEDMVYHRLVRWFEVQKKFPKRILFYRDGVGEDQFDACKGEIAQIKAAYKRMKDNSKTLFNRIGLRQMPDNGPKPLELTFIVVGKRHNTRFFPTSLGDTYGDEPEINGNLKPGLLVDRVVTRPEGSGKPDFFLQSHAAIKGTARSAHYVVLEQGKLAMDKIQNLTLAFCHNYQRATKAVSYCAPAYYADRLCDRGTHYLRGLLPPKGNPPSEVDVSLKDGPEGDKAYATEIARHFSQHPGWNMTGQLADRDPNPWHKDFDQCMFWL